METSGFLPYSELENELCAQEVVHYVKLQSNKTPNVISVLSKLRETILEIFIQNHFHIQKHNVFKKKIA